MSDVGGPVSPDDHEDVPTVGSTSSEDPAPAPAPTPEQQPDKTPAEGEDLAPSKDASLPSQPVPTAPSPAVPASSTSDAAPRPSPAPRRPKPPTKGILKPPPPPPKPTLGNRIRDIVTSSVSVVGGGAKSLFDPAVETDSSIAGPSSRAGPSTTSPQSMSATVGGTLNALSGRLGMGFSRLVAGSPSPSATSTPSSSPMSSRTIPLPETGGVPAPMSERSRQKQPLRRATFLLPTLSITYPISSQGEPWSQKVLDDRRRIESLHRTTMSTSSGAEYWNSTRLVALYENACRIREERPRVGIVRALELLPPHPRPRHLHLTFKPIDPAHPPDTAPGNLETPLNRHAAEALADLLTAEWGLSELKLENGVLEGDDALKPILHALLISGTLPTLSLAGNKKVRAGGWRLLAVFLKRAQSLRCIDLSDTSWDRKGIDYLVQALSCAPIPSSLPLGLSTSSTGLPLSPDRKHLPDPPTDTPPEKDEQQQLNGFSNDFYGSFIPPAPLLRDGEGDNWAAAVQTLRMDGCGLKATVLESLGQGGRASDLKNISLRRNRIGPLGAVALALMIRDYPDSAITMSSLSPSLNTAPSIHDPSGPTLDRSLSPIPYAVRSRRPPRRTSGASDDPALPPIPLVVSSSTGGITTRTLPEGYKPPPPPKHPLVLPGGGNSTMQDGGSFALSPAAAEGRSSNAEAGGASMALSRSVRALDGVERIGRLLTLDLKSNEIKNGVGYIAQVLKRNRTLRVLNLSDNRIEAPGLAALAEALKYNSSLETLDMSSNPCCGPTLDGIAALRTNFTVNTSLKRIFLSDTNLTTEGAIALAEFLPETKSLLHLDLTSNPFVDTAGTLAISVGLKSNTLIRCLDISIPPNDPELADLSQIILQACIRNTELAAANLKEGRPEVIWAPIKKSALVRHVKEADEARAEKERVEMAQSPEGMAREYVYTLRPEDVVAVSRETARDLQTWFEAGRIAKHNGFHAWKPDQLPKDDLHPLLDRARVLRERLVDQIHETTDDSKLERLLTLNDQLTTHIDASKSFQHPPRLLLPSQIISPETPHPPPNPIRGFHPRRHTRIPSHEISSPNFSIGDSDADSDAEELDVGKLPTSTSGTPNRVEAGSGVGLGMEDESVTSPVEKASRAWVEEEGEIFRKGTKLGVAEEDEVEENGDMPGEVLKQEILDTEVARSPTRRVIGVEEGEREGEEGGKGEEWRVSGEA